VVAPGAAANLLQLHRDAPNEWDAWDIDEHYRRHAVDLDVAESITVRTAGAEGVTIRVTRRHVGSAFRQDITLTRGSRSLEIVTTVDWHEQQTLLKLAFPLAVQAGQSASETQYGHVFRPTHTNTSWEAAKFEICAHRWIHVAEPGFGVAITNDRTYGHDVCTAARSDGGFATTVRLSLLRAPVYPDPAADQGEHIFRSVIVPGAEIVDAVREGYRTNLPVRSVLGSRDVAPIVSVSDPGVAVEAVKLAEDRSGDVIVRLYESLGQRTNVTVTAGFPVSTSTVTDLLERPLDGAATRAPIEITGPSADLLLRPFELITLRFARG